MITDKTDGALAEAQAFAKKIGLAEQLEGKLAQLEDWAGIDGELRLWKDFAPYSFTFQVLNSDKKPVVTGGLIFHGEHDSYGSGGAPTFSVCLTPTKGWAIHT